MSRYKKTEVFVNEEQSSAIARRMRKLQKIVHYGTSALYHPDVLDRSSLNTDTHIWKYGDRLYNLANKYYYLKPIQRYLKQNTLRTDPQNLL